MNPSDYTLQEAEADAFRWRNEFLTGEEPVIHGASHVAAVLMLDEIVRLRAKLREERDALAARVAELEKWSERYKAALRLIIKASAICMNNLHDYEDCVEECQRVAINAFDDVLDDGFGNRWPKCGPDCRMEIVRPGKVQCECDGSPDADGDRP